MGLNIIACVKSVLNGGMPGERGKASANMELNPFDRPVIEMALSLIREHGGTLTVLSMGPESASFGLYQAISMGADRAILICDPALRESDTYVTAKVLGRSIERLKPFDILLFGTRSSDSDTGHVGPQTSQMLKIPFVGNIHDLRLEKSAAPPQSAIGISEILPGCSNEGGCTCRMVLNADRKADGYFESYEIISPASFSVNPSSCEAEFTSLHGIESAFNDRRIEFWNNAMLGLEPHETGLGASPTKIVSWNRERKNKKCLFIEGSPEQKAEELAQKLSEAGFVG